MKINCLELANVKRVKALRLEPSENGLTVIGGRNGAGKTSVLDAIAYGFGGAKYRPTNLRREGAVGDTLIRIETDNGLIIERKGKNSDLHVTDRDGKRGGQAIIDALLSEFAINLPKFHNANAKEKARILLGCVGIDEEKLAQLDRDEKAKYDTRTVIGQQADQKAKAAKDMPWHDDVGEEPVSIKELIDQQQEIFARNGIKEEHRSNLESMKRQLDDVRRQIKSYEESIASFRSTEAKLAESVKEAETEDFTLESTEDVEKKIFEFEETNRKVNENAERQRRLAETEELSKQYDDLTKEIEAIRNERLALLNGVKFPLEGLSVDNGELTYGGKSWDCMSGAEQLIVDCAIASKINPECRFVLMDKLEQLDLETLRDFGKWLKSQDLQCIATRVSTGDECSITIVDGEAEEVARRIQPKTEGLPEY